MEKWIIIIHKIIGRAVNSLSMSHLNYVENTTRIYSGFCSLLGLTVQNKALCQVHLGGPKKVYFWVDPGLGTPSIGSTSPSPLQRWCKWFIAINRESPSPSQSGSLRGSSKMLQYRLPSMVACISVPVVQLGENASFHLPNSPSPLPNLSLAVIQRPREADVLLG